MSDEHLRELRLSSEHLFKGRLLDARRDTVRLPDGGTATREYIVHPGAVMVVPILSEHAGQWDLVMERQFRYPIGQVMIEFPAGKRDALEDMWACAQRELKEETGYSARQWARAGVLHPVIAYSTEVIEVWFARELTRGERHLDEGEFLDVFEASSSDLLGWCANGTVTDAKTLTAALWIQMVLSGQWSLTWQATSV